MAVNMRYVGSPAGLIKILHIIFGAITIGCGGASYYTEYVFERTFLWGAVTCFVISFLYLLAHLASDGLTRSGGNRGVDMVYHVFGGLLLLIGGALMIASVKDFDKNHCNPLPWGNPCQNNKTEKLVGGSFAIINGVLYLIAVPLIAMQREEPETMDWERGIKGYSAPSAGAGAGSASSTREQRSQPEERE